MLQGPYRSTDDRNWFGLTILVGLLICLLWGLALILADDLGPGLIFIATAMLGLLDNRTVYDAMEDLGIFDDW